MTRFEFWQEAYLTSLRRLNAYRVGDEEKLTRHAGRIADQALVRLNEAADQYATPLEVDILNGEEDEEDEDEENDAAENPRAPSDVSRLSPVRGG